MDALAIIGIVLGLALGAGHGLSGLVFGGLLGYLLAAVLRLNARVKALEHQLRAPEHARRPAPPAQPRSGPERPPGERAAVPVAESAVETGVADVTPVEAASAWVEPAHLETRPAATGGPSVVDRAVQAVTEFFTGGNFPVRVGVVVLFFGVAFLVRYAAEHGLLPIELRLLGAALGGLALLAIGWRLRTGRAAYALVLQGGGVGILYLTVFAALRLYALLPPALAFALLVALAALSSALAVLQDARALAVFGMSGGFLAPILASTGSGSHVMLFTYYALLNGGIFGIAWFKAWRSLNVIGFVFTFALSAAWGQRYYAPAYFASTEPFLLLFFLMYVAIAVLFAHRQPPQLRGYVDGSVVFGTPIVAFGLQAALVRQFEHGLAWSAAALGLFYLAVATVLWRRAGAGLRLLTEAFLALGVVFGSLAIPLAVDGRWTAAAWALEGAALVWIGVRQQRLPARLFGLLLQFGAGVALQFDPSSTGPWPLLNGVYLGGLGIALAGLFSAYYLYRWRVVLTPWEDSLRWLPLLWGLAWWLYAGLREIDHSVARGYRLQAALGYVVATGAALSALRRRLAWAALDYPVLALLPALALGALAVVATQTHPFTRLGYLVWPVAFAVQYWVLRRHEQRLPRRLLRWYHAAVLWLWTAVLTLECVWQVDRAVAGAGTWPLIGYGIVPAGVVLAVTVFGRQLAWPVGRHYAAYLSMGVAPIAAATWLWTVFSNLGSTGDPWPLPYLPLLNPLDVAQGFVFVVLIRWFGRAKMTPWLRGVSAHWFAYGLGAAAFLWLNAIVARSVHHWGTVPLTVHDLYGSTLFQTAIAVVWTLLALVFMVIATRRARRRFWLVGAGLLAAVVVKLFVVDLAGTGTIARIVSFLGVGLLLLVIGYVAPVPPKQEKLVVE